MRRGLLGLGLLALGTTWSGAARADGPCARASASSVRSFADQSPACPPERSTCVGLFVHVVVVDGAPVQTPDWFATKVEHANRLFAAIDVGFQVVGVDAVGPEFARVATREQRDEIGRGFFDEGVAHVFVVAQLDDVDIPGEVIRGVHWRHRGKRHERWVILSSISGSMVLAHELGHFFGLPHSRYPESVMNKRPREEPPWEARIFAEPEVAEMRARRDEMLATGFLERCPVAVRAAPEPEAHPVATTWVPLARRALVRRLAPGAASWSP